MELLGKHHELAKLIAAAGARSGVLIGSELQNPAFSNLSIVSAHYTASPDCTGTLAVIGPLRMQYPKMISTLECVAELVSESLSELLEA